MFLTLEFLEKAGACVAGRKWFAKYFPNGGEVLEILQSEHAHPDFLHWGYNNLVGSTEEKEAYWQQVKVSNCDRETIFRSDQINNCSYISRSRRVNDSSYIFSSRGIENSHLVVNSRNVKNGENIHESRFVYDSKKIIGSANITRGRNIVCCNRVVDSTNIYQSEDISNSHFVSSTQEKGTTFIEDSNFIRDCKNLKKCMFCVNLNDKEYHIFNIPVSKKQFELYESQLQEILSNYELSLADDWSIPSIPISSPTVVRLLKKHYSSLPEELCDWVKTLPGYSAELFYLITFYKMS